MRDLEATVAHAARRAAALRIPPEAREALEAVAQAFAGALDAEGRRQAAARALARLEPLAEPEWAASQLAQPPSVLRGVGPRGSDALARRGLGTVLDLLFHLPARYDDRRTLSRVGDLEVGRRATFVARVLVCDFVLRRGRFRRSFEAVVGDETGTVNLKWFRGGDAISRMVQKDALLLVTGEVRRYRFAKELIHPEVERLAEGDEPDAGRTARIVPDYVTPEGVHARALRRALERAVEEYVDLVGGHLPEALVRARRLPGVADSLRRIHLPSGADAVADLVARRTPAHQRLVLEELYLLELGLALRRERRCREVGISLAGHGPRTAAAERRLPFRLTGAQQRVWSEIRADLARPHPMNRLLQGDVGSGKTVVAFLAARAAAEAGRQSALMAPTELLAEQHHRTLSTLAGHDPGLRVALLTSSLARGEADELRAALEGGEIDLVVGTHALVQESVRFRALGLVVIDEQHRFGVLQRQALSGKGEGGRAPHVLVMTATPIPRTLSLTVYGDLDLSVIDELPPGRKPVRTALLRAGQGRRVMDLLHQTVERGEQVYVVYPLVEESEKSDLRAASESAERLARAMPGTRVDLVHGRLDAGARAEAMGRFERGETQVLVSTTVIEVGVDVPNATLMIVEHAERFGLAQLHQLRGRVGRGERPGTCLLVARGTTEGSEARIEALLATQDGFEIADADLRIRGPGEFLGTRQHGRLPDLRVADLVRDARWISVARESALETVRRDPGLRRHPHLARAVEGRWGPRLDLATVG